MEAICRFSLQNVVSITHAQNIICSKTRSDGTTHEQTIICRQLFVDNLVGSLPMKSTQKIHLVINTDNFYTGISMRFKQQRI